MTKGKKTNKPRFTTVSYRGIKGIRKDARTKKFVVEKCVRGGRHSASFGTLKEAADWKKNFHPGLNWQPLAYNQKEKDALEKKLSGLGIEIRRPSGSQKNGQDLGYTFGDVWELYAAKHLSRLEGATFEIHTKIAQHFYGGLMAFSMVEINADLVSRHLALKKRASEKVKSKKRYSFNSELKNLKALLNWYRENIDAQFVNPVLKRHKLEGEIGRPPRKNKKMRRHDLAAFFSSLGSDGQFWRDIAETQFYFSGRIQEVAGLQWESVDFEDGIIHIENVAVWSAKKSFRYLKDTPKNGEERLVPMTGRLREVLERRLLDRKPSGFTDARTGGVVPCDFVFHQEGKPLAYRWIQYRYNKALKKAGLGHKFSSTHILRHSMANLVRERLGIEHAQAVGGWKTRSIVENVYTDRPAHLTKDALENIEDFMSEGGGPDTTKKPRPPRPGLKLIG